MGFGVRVSRGVLLLTACTLLAALPPCGFAFQVADSSSAPTDPRALYQALNQIRLDATHVYTVHELNLRRDVVSLTLTDGKLAFFEPLGGRITGAVFTGRGHIIATPRDRGERLSLAQFLGVPILDQTFSRAYFRFTDGAASEIEQQIASTGAATTSDAEFAESWEEVVANLNPWHSLRTLVDWLSTDPMPYFYAGLAGDSIGAFDVLVDSRRSEQVLFGQPRETKEMRDYDIWASFRSADAPKIPIKTFAPLDYRVDTTIADDLSMEGKTTLHMKAMRAGERVLWLELSRNLTVREIQSEHGQPLEYFQNEDLSSRDILRHGNDSLLVVLPAPVQGGEELRLVVKYRGSVISDAGNGVAFVGERGTWYAHLSGSDQFVPFDLEFRWPKRFTLVATGTKVESSGDADPHTGSWRSDVPFATAGFNLGEYKTENTGASHPRIELYANRQLESAITARLRQYTGNSPMTLPPTPRSMPSVRSGPGLTPDPQLPNATEALTNLANKVLDSIRFLEKFNGPFPFDHLDVSQIPGTFGQGWPGLVYLSTLAFLPPETQQRAGIAERTREQTRELMPFHEVVHQWWGNVVGSASYRDTWIDEALATYLSLLYADSKKPSEHLLTEWLKHFRTTLIAKAPGSPETVAEVGPLSFGFRLTSSKTLGAYEAITYGKGMWVIHMLREMLLRPAAKDPDGRFREFLQSILAEHRFHALSTAEFQRGVEQQMTPAMDLEGTHTMDWFFDQWVRGTGIPHYAVRFQVKPRGKEFMVTGTLEQSGVEDIFTAPVPLYAARQTGKPERLGVVVSTGPETRFQFLTPNPLKHILIDPHLTVLCRTD
jgi:Peptidase family M1 domain